MKERSNYTEVTFGILLILMLFFVAIPIKISRNHNRPIEIAFNKFIKNYNRTYNQTEYKRRYHIFEKNLDILKKINSTKKYGKTAKFGITKFTDLTDSEFTKNYLFNDTKKNESILYPIDNINLIKTIKIDNINEFQKFGYPMEFDWRDYGIITNIRNQGLCGSCYAHSVIATIESKLALKLNKIKPPIQLSVQQMIDCAEYFNYGCLGGDTCDLLEWLKNENITILPEILYPMSINIKKRQCQTMSILKKSSISELNFTKVRVSNFTCWNFTGYEYNMLAFLVKNGPVTASVNGLLWKNYLGGVIKYHCNNGESNHAVQIVGYDLTVDDPYYIVRNSWGTDFGINGYAKISIGNNVCNIASEVSAIDVNWEFSLN